MQFHGHQLADQRNLHLHRAALAKLRLHPELQPNCLRLVESWLAEPDQPSRPWLAQWRLMLVEWPVERMADVVLDEINGQALRQCSPLGPLLTPQERWTLLAEVNRAAASESISGR